jgi:hypothetical protein
LSTTRNAFFAASMLRKVMIEIPPFHCYHSA